ncbi:MAG: response regulator [Candidatus Marinimicrobia bacterium]|nr:response regulator [Candidatus Neomarinimicrobiota bacterium]
MDDIRKKALDLLAKNQQEPDDIFEEKDFKKLIHELKVHQIELEIQNENLIELNQELEQSRNHYFNLFNNAPVGYLMLSKSATIMEVNTTFTKLVGKPLNELRNSYFIDLIDSGSREIFLGRFKAIFNSPEGKNLEARLQTGKGEIFVNLKGEKIKLGKKDDFLFLSVVDITERKKNEEKINHLNRVLKAVRDIDKLISTEKNRDRLLSESIKVLGATRGYQNVWIALYEQDFKKVTHFYANDSNSKIDRIKTLLESGRDIYCVEKAKASNTVVQASYNENDCNQCPVCEDGLLFCTYTSRLRYNDQVYGIISSGLEFGFPRSDDEKLLFTEIANDLSYALHWIQVTREREELLENLRYERDLIANIMNTSPSGITLVNSEGLITFMNQKAREIMGLEGSQENYSYNDSKFQITTYDGNPYPEDKLPFSLVKKSGKPVSGVKHAVCLQNGVRRLLSISSSPSFDKDHNFNGMVSVITDVTQAVINERERTRLEKEAARSQRLETIGTLAGGIAHDFNNILTPIVGYSDMLLQGRIQPDRMNEYVSDIYDAAIRAKDLVAQILSFSRNDEQNREPIYIYPVVKEVVKLLQHTIPATITIVSAVDETSDKILADATKIHQVLMNLCTNAFHAMEETGGVLYVSLEQVNISRQESDEYYDLNPGKHLKILVKDTGTGIEQELLEKIFEPFFTTKEVDKGTGLGLSVVHGVVKSHDGMIIVNSEVGKGSEFIIYFPVFDTQKSVDFNLDTPELKKGNESILIVDDNEAVLKLASKFLSSLGYQVTVSSTSDKALEIYRNNVAGIDLLITDLTMPGMTGLTLSEKIHEINKNLPVIMMTGYGSKISKQEQLEAGIIKILTKPVLIHELSEFIREIFDEK